MVNIPLVDKACSQGMMYRKDSAGSVAFSLPSERSGQPDANQKDQPRTVLNTLGQISPKMSMSNRNVVQKGRIFL